MKKLLIAGSDNTVGSNIALTLSEHFQVITCSTSPTFQIDGCQAETLTRTSRDSIQSIIANHHPDWIIHCGIAGEWSWDQTSPDLSPDMIDEIRWWSQATEQQDIDFTLISSDSVFTGPWMFHEEDSHGLSETNHANIARSIEREALAWNENCLVVRTNAFGWTPGNIKDGAMEQLQLILERGHLDQIHCQRHATPILATELAECLESAVAEKLVGIYHIAGAERVNPIQFARRFSELFDLNWPLRMTGGASDQNPQASYGHGETSLMTKKIRKALCVPMPTLTESLDRLREQQFNGYCDRMNAGSEAAHRKVA